MSEIDPELRAAWKDASREEPPAALDDAVRAAARREVGARPGVFRAAPRWLPLAAAATVAALAVGIAQMTPPDEVTPAITPAPTNALQRSAKADADKQTVAATPAPPRDVPAAAPVPKPSLREPAPQRPPREGPVSASAPQATRDAAKLALKEQPRGAVEEADRGTPARNRSDGFAAPPNEQSREKKMLAARQAPQRAEESSERDQALKQKAELAAASPVVRPAPAASNAQNAPLAEAERSQLQPFPASPMPAQAAGGNAPPPPATIAAAAAGAATASPPAPAPAVAARTLASPSSSSGALSGSIDAKQRANAEALPAKDAGALGKTSAADSAGDKVTPERRKDLAPLAPDEWIKRIRRLIAEGRNEDAAKELVAFRREYKERSDSLLPSDLRQFKP